MIQGAGLGRVHPMWGRRFTYRRFKELQGVQTIPFAFMSLNELFKVLQPLITTDAVLISISTVKMP